MNRIYYLETVKSIVKTKNRQVTSFRGYRFYSKPATDELKPRITTFHIISVYVHNTMLVLLCQVSFSFWTVVYPNADTNEYDALSWISLQGHLLNTLVAVFDVLVSKTPFLMMTLKAYYVYGLVYVMVQVYLSCFTSYAYIYKGLIAWCTS